MCMNNVRTQNVLRVCSLSFNIVQLFPLPPPASLFPFIHLPLSFSLSPSQEWCLSLRLCAPAMSTPTPSCTWTWARTPGSSRGRMPRSDSKIHLETKTHTPFILPRLNMTSLSFSLCFQNLYLFLSQPNCLVHLDLSGTDCSVDSVSFQRSADDQLFM